MQSMANLQTVRTLAKYRMWADRLTFDAVAALPPGEAAKPRQTLFKSMIGTLNHNLVIDRIWQGHLEGRDHGLKARNVVLHAELDALWAAQQAMDQWYIDWTGQQTEATLGETVHFKYVSGEPGAMTRGDMLMHVVNHATFHRGWVAEMFFQVPAKMPAGDLPDFLKSGD